MTDRARCQVGRAGATARRPAASVPPVTAQEFLTAFAAQVGVPAPSSQELDVLLQVAAVAAHSSERLAAPLACWMGGASGMPAGDLLAAAQRIADEAAAG